MDPERVECRRVSGRADVECVFGDQGLRDQLVRRLARRGEASRCGGDGVVSGADSYRVPEREQHDRVPEQLPGVRVVHAGDGGEGGDRGLCEGESPQRARRDLQGPGRGKRLAAPRCEALGVFHGHEAPVRKSQPESKGCSMQPECLHKSRSINPLSVHEPLGNLDADLAEN